MKAAAAEVEYENYCRMTRIEEIAEFAGKIGARRLGVATCVGLISESRAAAKFFRRKGFEVYGIACKVGAQAKTRVGIDPCCQAVERQKHMQSDNAGEAAERGKRPT